MRMTPLSGPLRIGMLGAGFMARFHLAAFEGVRNAVIAGVHAPTAARREAFAQAANGAGLGPCVAYPTLEAMLAADLDAIWIAAPNDTRLATMRTIAAARAEGRTRVFAVACEKPLARTLAEAREMLRLAGAAGLLHGYLENQVFSTAVRRGKEIIWRRAVPNSGRPYIARAAEEHSGPHEPWFWDGVRQGGGVLSDMMCHSIEVARHLLTAPGERRDALTPVSVNATVATLKWQREAYARALAARTSGTIDYARRPAEDFARGLITLRDPEGNAAVIEATTSWAYVGPGLRITLELLGPEYAMEFNSLATGLKLFLSRSVSGHAGEDLVEKQNAEQGLMPVLEDEAGIYGYTIENRHFVEAFRTGTMPDETFADGVGVVELLMALYRSAELGRTVALPDPELETYVPPVARPQR